MTSTPTTDLPVDQIALGAADTWGRPDREGLFARLRAERPVSFHEEPEFIGFPKGPGFWSLVRYDDVVRASRDSETFISGRGSNIGDLPIELLEFFGSMINMDAPRQTKLRTLVNRGSRRVWWRRWRRRSASRRSASSERWLRRGAATSSRRSRRRCR